MTARRLGRSVAAAAAAALGFSLLLVPSAASAAVVTTIAFETAGPVSVGFGDDWYLRLSVSSSYEEGPTLRLLPTDGTVDVYFSGIGGAFATALPIQPDGLVYVSQPLAAPLLAAGEYEVSAIFHPTPGGYYDSSQTATPLMFTVTALGVDPTVEVVNDVAVSERPVITASLGGAYVEKTGGAPAGTWHFIVTDDEAQPLFETNIAQEEGSTEPLRVEIDSKLEKGVTYTVTSAFTPVDELAGGLVVADLPDSTFTTPSGTFGEAVTAPIPLPIWAALALLLVVLGLAAAAVVIGVKLRGRAVATDPDAAQRVPGDPQNVEVVSLGALGLPDPETIPELLPEGQTEKLPVSTTWLLSDVEPATSAPEFSEAPTERLDAIVAEELPTELLESTDQVADAPGDDEPTKP